MISYRLCQTKKAENPYYIENIGIHIYTIEELCFYICNNIELLDESFINGGLTRWIAKELEMPFQAKRMDRLLKGEAAVSEVIIYLIREVQYLLPNEQKEFKDQLLGLESQDEMTRKKRKADCLLSYKKYGNALGVYKEIAGEFEQSAVEFSFKAGTYHNIGCVYAQMFQLKEALRWFEKAYRMLHSEETLGSLLRASCLAETKEEYRERVRELGVDQELAENIRGEIIEKMEALPGEDDTPVSREDLMKLTNEYHKNTGY